MVLSCFANTRAKGARLPADQPRGENMCELDDMEEFSKQPSNVSRRQFGALALGAGFAMALPRLADAAETKGVDVEIKPPDGTCDAYFVSPVKGRHPAVLTWPDIFGLRPASKEMATRLAGSGYSVLVINPFYRTQKAPTAPEHPDFNDPATRQALMTHADRIGAAAPFHGGGLVTDKPESPHLLIPQMKAQYLVAIAENDDTRQPEAKTVLKDAFAKANLPAEVEVYAGAQHGWCPPDAAVYNHDQAEKAWSRQLALFSKALA